MKPTISPAPTLKDTSLTAICEPNRLVISLTDILMFNFEKQGHYPYMN